MYSHAGDPVPELPRPFGGPGPEHFYLLVGNEQGVGLEPVSLSTTCGTFGATFTIHRTGPVGSGVSGPRGTAWFW